MVEWGSSLFTVMVVVVVWRELTAIFIIKIWLPCYRCCWRAVVVLVFIVLVLVATAAALTVAVLLKYLLLLMRFLDLLSIFVFPRKRAVPALSAQTHTQSMPQRSNIVSTWADTGKVHIYDIKPQLLSLDGPTPAGMSSSTPPVFTFGGHLDEGFAMDWSSAREGA